MWKFFLCLFFLSLSLGEEKKDITSEAKIIGSFTGVENLIDGKIETTAEADLAKQAHYLLLTFSRPHFFKEIKLSWDFKTERGKYVLEISDDIINWKVVKEKIKIREKLVGNSWQNVIEINQEGQYLKIRFPQKKRKKPALVKLKEIKIFSGPLPKLEITEIVVEEIEDHRATVRWKTNLAIPSSLRYGNNRYCLDQVLISPSAKRKHRLTLNNLLAGTNYFFVIQAKTERGIIESKINTFKTTGIPLPIVVAVKILEKKKHSVILFWRTNVKTKGVVEYGEEETYGRRVVSEVFQQEHRVELKGFKPLQKGYFLIKAEDELGRTTQSSPGHFTTAEDNIALHCLVEGSFVHLPDDPYVKKNRSNPLARVTDGVISYFTGMAQSGNPEEEDQWVKIDLGRERACEWVIVFWRSLAYSQEYSLLGSSDGENWEEIKRNLNAEDGVLEQCQTDRVGVTTPCWIVKTKVGGKTYRYVKLYMKKGSKYFNKFPDCKFVQLMEIKVYPVIN
jgi:hypothetical protein